MSTETAKQDEVSFAATWREQIAVRKIVNRAAERGLIGESKVSSEMDLVATHANGNPMDFAKLLAADDFNFAHDFCGIARHLDRETGKLMGCFVPRFSKPEAPTPRRRQITGRSALRVQPEQTTNPQRKF